MKHKLTFLAISASYFFLFFPAGIVSSILNIDNFLFAFFLFSLFSIPVSLYASSLTNHNPPSKHISLEAVFFSPTIATIWNLLSIFHRNPLIVVYDQKDSLWTLDKFLDSLDQH